MEVSGVSALQRAIIGGPGSMKWYFLPARSLVPLSWWIAQSTVWSVASGANLRSKVPECSRTRTVVPSAGGGGGRGRLASAGAGGASHSPCSKVQTDCRRPLAKRLPSGSSAREILCAPVA